jgi:hypothetical protein
LAWLWSIRVIFPFVEYTVNGIIVGGFNCLIYGLCKSLS